MIRRTLVATIIMAAIAIIGGFIIVSSVSYTAGSVIIQNSKSQQFNTGLTLLVIGVMGVALVAWFNAVSGRNSIVRRRPRPWWSSPPS